MTEHSRGSTRLAARESIRNHLRSLSEKPSLRGKKGVAVFRSYESAKSGVTISRLHGLLIGPTSALHEVLEFSADSHGRHSPRMHNVLVRYDNTPGRLPGILIASGLPSGGNELQAARQLAEMKGLPGDPTQEQNTRALLIARTVLLRCSFQDRSLSLLAARRIVG